MKKIILTLSAILLTFAQAINLTISAPRLQGVNRLSINDFDLLRGAKAEIFSASLSFSGHNSAVNNLVVSFSLIKDGKAIVTGDSKGISNVFPRPSSNPYRISSGTLAKGFLLDKFSGGSETIKFNEFKFTDENPFTSGALTTELPSGVYIVRIAVNADGFSAVHRDVRFNIIKRTKINLINPRGKVVSTTPVFIWNGAERYPKLTLYVVEDKGDWQRSRSGNPVLRTDVTGKNSFRFPSAADRPLEDGKAYFWAIIPSMKSTSGVAELRKDIAVNRFEINTSGEDSSVDPRIAELKKLIGPAFQQIAKELAGYKVVKREIKYGDGSSASDQQKALLKLTNAVRSGKYKVNVKID